MAIQHGRRLYVAYRVEATFNTAPGTASGKKIRINPSPGLRKNRAVVRPGEIREDQLSPMGRLASSRVEGSYVGDFHLGTWDDWLEAVVRGTWAAAAVVNFVTHTTVTVASNTSITCAGGSFITSGIRVGDIIYLTNYSTVGNNNINLRVTAIAATTITVAAGTALAAGAADAAGEINIRRKLVNGSSATRRSFYIEEYFSDIDQSKVAGGCRIVGFTIRGGPDQMATIEFRVMGASLEPLATGSSPYYTSPTVTTSIGLVFSDGILRLGATDLAVVTGFELNVDLSAEAIAVAFSDTVPDVFDNDLVISGSLSVLRQDLTYYTALSAETEYELAMMLREPESELRDCFGIFLPRIKFTNVDDPLGGGSGLIETLPFIVGKKESVTGYNDTMIALYSSV